MTDIQIYNWILRAISESQRVVPIDTGNMRYNSLKLEKISEDTYMVFFNQIGEHKPGELDGIAPYIPYTNEPWISPKWKGKKNPNQGWFNEKFVPLFIRKLAEELARYDGAEAEIYRGEK